jgi:hypothetical protein
MIRNKTRKVKTRKAKTKSIKGGKIPERIGIMNPTWGGKRELKKTIRNKDKK